MTMRQQIYALKISSLPTGDRNRWVLMDFLFIQFFFAFLKDEDI